MRFTYAIAPIATLLMFSAAMAQTTSRTTAELKRAKAQLSKDPLNEDKLLRVIETGQRHGGMKNLLSSYKQQLKLPSANPRTRLIFAEILRYSGNCAAAKLEYERLEKARKELALARFGQARCHAQSEDWNRAVASMRKALLANPRRANRIIILKSLMNTALQGAQWAVATEAHSSLIALSPNDLFLRVEFARALADHGQTQKAISVWQQIRARSKNDIKIQVKTIQEIAKLMGQTGRFNDAVKVIQSHLRKLPDEHWGQLDLQATLVEIYRKWGRLEQYVEALEKGRRTYPVLLLLARLYEELGDDKKALQAFRLAVRQRPANVDAQRAVLRLVKRSGSTDELIQEYKSIIRRSPGEPNYVLELAEIHLKAENNKPALTLIDRLSRQFRNDAAIHESIVDLLLRYDLDRVRVERAFKALIRLEPHQEQHLIQLGLYFFGQNARAKAQSTWRKLLKAVPDKGRAHYLLAQVHAEHDMHTDARSHYRQAIKLAPKRIKYIKSYAKYLERIDNYSDATSAWLQVMKITPPRHWNQLRDARSHIVALHQKTGTLNFRMEEYRRRYEDDPPDLRAGLFLAEAYIQQKKYAQSAVVLRGLLRQRPRDLEVLLYLEGVCRKLNLLSEAIDLLQRIANLDPSQARGRLQRMARLSMDLNRQNDAIKFAQLAVQLNPSNATAAAHLGDLLNQAQRFEKSLWAYRRSLSLSPGQIDVIFKVAQVLKRLKRDVEYEKALLAIVSVSRQPSEILRAGRELLQSSNNGVLERFEQQLLAMAFKHSQKPVYRKLLVELYNGIVQRLALETDQRRIDQLIKKIGSRGSKVMLDSLADADMASRTKVLRILVTIGQSGSALPIVRLLEEPDDMLRMQALSALCHMNATPAINAIAALAEKANLTVSIGAVWALGCFESPKAQKALTSLLKVRQRVGGWQAMMALALGIGAKKSSYEAVESLFLEGSSLVRPYAAWALGQIGDPRAIKHLARRLPLEGSSTRRQILWALGTIGGAKAIGAISTSLWAVDWSIREAAIAAFSQATNDQTRSQTQLKTAYRQLHNFDKHSVKIRGALQRLTEHATRRMMPPGWLARYSKPIQSAIFRVMKSNNSSAIHSIVDTLGNNTAGTPTIKLTDDSDQESVPANWQQPLFQSFESLSQSSDEELRAISAKAIARTKWTGGIAVLKTLINDPSADVRRQALIALGQMGGSAVSTTLINKWKQGVLKDNWITRVTLCKSIALITSADPSQVEQLSPIVFSLLKDTYPEVRVAALETLKTMGTAARAGEKDVINALWDVDRTVALHAIDAIVAMRVETALKSLQRMTKHADSQRRNAAKAALKRLQ